MLKPGPIQRLIDKWPTIAPLVALVALAATWGSHPAVAVVEVGLIVTLMISGGSQAETLARDTVFAAVMITCNGIVGVSILTAALRDRVASSTPRGRRPPLRP